MTSKISASRYLFGVVFTSLVILFASSFVFAQTKAMTSPAKEEVKQKSQVAQPSQEAPKQALSAPEALKNEKAHPAAAVAAKENAVAQEEAASKEAEPTAEETLTKSENVTLDFKEADINNVLKIISYKSGINIVPTPDVVGMVTIRLVDVPWERALDVLLKTYGYGYQKQGNIILVSKIENMSKLQADEILQTEIFRLKFLDAQDAQKILISMLSNRGKISILYARGQKGWQFGTFKIGKEATSSAGMVKEADDAAKKETVSIEKNAAGDFISREANFEPSVKSKVLVITDTVSSLDRIRDTILPLIDRKPRQVLIETKLIEVNKDKLRDIGMDWGFGNVDNAASNTVLLQQVAKNGNGEVSRMAGAHVLGSEVTPSIFGPKSVGILGTEPYNTGAEIIFQKLTGFNMEAIMHALEEDVKTNVLSAPRIVTLDNQEASILVGYHTPILKSEVSGGTSTDPSKLTQTLDYYQEIGIRLNVVPQINEDGYISMLVHPSVTSSSSNVEAMSYVGTTNTTVRYPIIDVRETQTQILVKDGETIVIGGLLKDVIGKQTLGVPFLSKIPFIGSAFRRDTYDTQKVDLLIFITARILKDGEFTQEEIDRLQKNLGKEIKVVSKKIPVN